MNANDLVLKGQIVRLAGRTVFKIGVVIGPSKAPGKARVVAWQNASRSWSRPSAEAVKSLDRIFLSTLSDRERVVVSRAQKAVRDVGGISHSGGAEAIRRIVP